MQVPHGADELREDPCGLAFRNSFPHLHHFVQSALGALLKHDVHPLRVLRRLHEADDVGVVALAVDRDLARELVAQLRCIKSLLQNHLARKLPAILRSDKVALCEPALPEELAKGEHAALAVIDTG
eukprot:CAMPEP_0179974678 /NCGR_PEP_ID=MMETSP0983-20121128/38210_1 /TAXON_ID=483367 /ORGANISM="non described non described, Strain CCMP 2436" /LENGTH=125 /DNA_ID=CAMNT_0021890927 /DNA_START=740 /DNA_END=1114 /DNA_ORIENTATION=-